jgi:mannitol/fructose-specific phosphotransferase system IIA component (Ntr-type)
MTNFVVRDAIVPSLAATTREDAIRELVKSLQHAGFFRDSEIEEIVAAVLRREQLGSTGIGRNIAIPHSRYGGVERLIGTVGISQGGIPFDSVDQEPVHILVLLVSPQDRPGDHLRALECVVRVMRDDRFVKELRQATTREAIWLLLDSAKSVWERS